MLQHLLIHLRFLQSQIGQFEAEINRKLKEESEQVDRPCTIPGVDRITACALIAEIGLDMAHFASERHIAFWAYLCPGNAESAGKRLSGATRKGSPNLCRSLCQAAWIVSRRKHCYFAALFKRIASRGGLKKAVIAVAHSMLITVYFILK
jgi:transposase